jgi:hypothetical protein
MMLFVRGIKGNLKLNPAIKIWGGLLLLLVLIVGGLAHRFFEFREAVTACETRGGTWIGGALPSSFCALDQKKGDEW